MHAIIETNAFAKKAEKLLGVREYESLIATLASNPDAGDLMVGTGGFRKLRLAREGGGKSGGFRVIYFFHCVGCPLYLTDIFGKNEKDNLTQEQCNALAKAAELIKQAHKK